MEAKPILAGLAAGIVLWLFLSMRECPSSGSAAAPSVGPGPTAPPATALPDLPQPAPAPVTAPPPPYAWPTDPTPATTAPPIPPASSPTPPVNTPSVATPYTGCPPGESLYSVNNGPWNCATGCPAGMTDLGGGSCFVLPSAVPAPVTTPSYPPCPPGYARGSNPQAGCFPIAGFGTPGQSASNLPWSGPISAPIYAAPVPPPAPSCPAPKIPVPDGTSYTCKCPPGFIPNGPSDCSIPIY